MRTSKGEPSLKYLGPAPLRLQMFGSASTVGHIVELCHRNRYAASRAALTSAIACSSVDLDKIQQKVCLLLKFYGHGAVTFTPLPSPPLALPRLLPFPLEKHLLASLAECATQVTAN